MTREEEARRAALDAFRRSIDRGADREVAYDVALAKYRAVHLSGDEYHARAVVAAAVAEEEQLLGRRLPMVPEPGVETPEAD